MHPSGGDVRERRRRGRALGGRGSGRVSGTFPMGGCGTEGEAGGPRRQAHAVCTGRGERGVKRGAERPLLIRDTASASMSRRAWARGPPDTRSRREVGGLARGTVRGRTRSETLRQPGSPSGLTVPSFGDPGLGRPCSRELGRLVKKVHPRPAPRGQRRSGARVCSPEAGVALHPQPRGAGSGRWLPGLRVCPLRAGR